MLRTKALPLVLSLTGLVAVVFGVQQELVQFRPMYDATIQSGWGGPLNHEERLLGRIAVVGLLGVVASLRWRLAAVCSVGAGVVVGFYATRAVVYHALEQPLYTGLPLAGGETGQIVFGAEPYLLLLGAAGLVAAGVVRLRVRRSDRPSTADRVAVDLS